MALRESPVRTAALVAADRANAKKSTGPSTPQGKARVALNPLGHGAYAVRLPEKLLRAGDREGELLYRWLRQEISAAFPRSLLDDEEQADQMAAKAWCAARAARARGAKPECPLDSEPLWLRVPPSIKDWARGSAAADRAGILVATAPLLDAAAGGEGARAGGGAGAVARPARRALAAAAVPLAEAQPLGGVDTAARSLGATTRRRRRQTG